MKNIAKIKILSLFLIAAIILPANVFGAIVPNDEFYKQEQVSYFNQINLPQAWETTKGSKDVIIAIIDAGVDTDHPDILSNMWFNRGEKALNGIDDDSNGFVDDLNGWDFIENDSDPHPKFNNEYSFGGANHGTTVAGVAASVTNNNIGLAGVCWNCKIMALRALDAKGEGTTTDIAKAIDYAIQNGADIINMSFVGGATDAVLSDAIDRAYEAGIVLVSAVGNDAEDSFIIGGDLDFRPLYPACSDGPAGMNHIIGVGSVDEESIKSTFSNYGFNCIDINAPGDGVAAPQLFDPKLGEEFESKYRGGWRGTSLAAPFVTGVAGLMKSVNPKLTNDQVLSIIRETAIDITKFNMQFFGQIGAGLLDAGAAVSKAAETAGLGTAKKVLSFSSKKSILVSSGINRQVSAMITDNLGDDTYEWLAYPTFFRGGAELVSGDVDGDGAAEIISGAGGGGGPQVRIFSSRGDVEGQFFAYDATFRGGVHIATADFDKDGIDEIVTSAGAGLSSVVRIVDKNGKIKWSFSVTAEGLNGGVTVNAADIDSDGEIEVITGTGGGSLPLVQIFDKLGNKEASWLAYPEFFRGGVNVSVGDVDADGALEVVTAAGDGGGPQVRIFSSTGTVEGQFFAFEDTFRGGARLAVGNVDADSSAEIIVGSGIGRESEVRVFSKFGVGYVQDSMFEVFEDDYQGGVHVGI
ncbi:hypothetical protein CL632_01375 [bacterium]|jgi:hypothetical protein|nr:hypothetical protein [bacterium]MDP6571640.1 S8 family serine peptidase [Patescibacteria group bacterium]MDP6756460.1 S8 family serine peptidase [Patescibacteria group bacterium]|tara:strand:+ start:2415 stop:4493 length:2079 start_codon:yes stop_codon:yes gene_type:complete